MANRTGKGRNFRTGRRPELNPDLKDVVTTRAMDLRRECKTLRVVTEIVNAEFGYGLAITTVSRWIDERIKPELEEASDAYRQHLLEQISVLKEAAWKRAKLGDEKAIASWTRLLDREMRLTGVEKPIQLQVTSNIENKETEFSKMLDRMRRDRGDAPAAEGHVIQGEVVRRSEG